MRTLVTTFVIFVAVSTLADAGGPLVRSYPFEPGVGGYAALRIPALITTNSGTLLALVEARQTVHSDTHNIDIALRRSTDGGRTWGPVEVVFDNGNDTAGNPVPVVDHATGDIVLVFGTNPYETIPRTDWVMRSSDDGFTWSTPVDITRSVQEPGWIFTGHGPGHGIQLKRGPHAGRLVIPHWYATTRFGWETTGTQVIYSDDGGHTWDRGGCIFPHGSEGTVVELTNGDACLNIRHPNLTRAARLVGYSPDGGESFRPFELDYELPVNACEGALLRYSAVDQGDHVDRILFSGPLHVPAGSGGPMTVFSSFDETRSWSHKKIVDVRGGYYSDMTVLPDGRIGLLYENRGIYYARFSIGWLDDPSRVFWGFDEKEPGMNASTERYAIKDTRGYGLDATADRALAYVSGSPSYGGTSALRFTGEGAVRLTDNEPYTANYKNNLLDFERLKDTVHERNFTIEAVVRSTAHSSGRGTIVAKDADRDSPSWWLGMEAGRLRFAITDGYGNEPAVLSRSAVNDGDWHHVAAVRDTGNDQLRLYCDGRLIGTADDDVVTNYAIDGRTTHRNDHAPTSPNMAFMYKPVPGPSEDASEYSAEADLYVKSGKSALVGFGFGMEPNVPCLFYSKWSNVLDDRWHLVVGGKYYAIGSAGQGADEVVKGRITLNLGSNTVTGTITGPSGAYTTTRPYAYTSGIDKILVLSDKRHRPGGIDVDNIVVKQDGVEIYSEGFNRGSDLQGIVGPPFGWRDAQGYPKDIRITDNTKHSTSVPNDKDVVVGSSNAGGEDFVGDIDLVRISAGALMADDFLKPSSKE